MIQAATSSLLPVLAATAEAVLPDRALYLPSFSHFLIVNKLLSPHATR